MTDESTFQTLECQSPICGFRFPLLVRSSPVDRCPRCGADLRLAASPYTSARVAEDLTFPSGPEVEVVLDSIRSAWNVGSMFRSADGAGVRKIHLCGTSPTPENPKTVKTALGAESTVPWSYSPNGLTQVKRLKQEGLRLWALEGGEQAVSLFQAVKDQDRRPVALVIGNEIAGVDPEILGECEKVVAIPMQGYKRSLNVAIAFGIAVYLIRFSNADSLPD